MTNNKIFAVLTGDLAGSSRFKSEEQRNEVLSALKDSFDRISPPDIIASCFMIHRGDSFQGVLGSPEEALKAAILIRAGLLSKSFGKKLRLDARIAIGVGTIDYLSADQVGEWEGEAFRNSGLELDRMKGERHTIIKTPWDEVNEELETECALLDALIDRWTTEQAEAIMYQLQGWKQEEIAKKLNTSQSAVSQRQRNGGARAVQLFAGRFRLMIKNKVKNL
jgi:hypothetical protein